MNKYIITIVLTHFIDLSIDFINLTSCRETNCLDTWKNVYNFNTIVNANFFHIKAIHFYSTHNFFGSTKKNFFIGNTINNKYLINDGSSIETKQYVKNKLLTIEFSKYFSIPRCLGSKTKNHPWKADILRRCNCLIARLVCIQHVT